MKRKKPSIIRYYKNGIGQYCELSGYPKAVETAIKVLKRQKRRLVLIRVSRKEHDLNRPAIGETVKSLGMGYKWGPQLNRRKEIRLGTFQHHHDLYYSHDGIWR